MNTQLTTRKGHGRAEILGYLEQAHTYYTRMVELARVRRAEREPLDPAEAAEYDRLEALRRNEIAKIEAELERMMLPPDDWSLTREREARYAS